MTLRCEVIALSMVPGCRGAAELVQGAGGAGSGEGAGDGGDLLVGCEGVGGVEFAATAGQAVVAGGWLCGQASTRVSWRALVRLMNGQRQTFSNGG